MKPLLSVKIIALAISAGMYSCASSQYAQNSGNEYDDMYYSSNDRTPVLVSSSNTTVIERPADNTQDVGVGVGYNSKTVNPDYGLPQDADEQSAYAEDEYFVEDYDKEYIQDAVDEYLRSSDVYSVRRSNRASYYRDFDDIFWSDPAFYTGTIFDPLYRSTYGIYSPFAYRSFYRPYSSFYRPYGRGFNLSLNFGFGFGRFGRGFYSPYYSRFYDPFFDPFYYGRGYYGGFGRSYFGGFGFGNIWCPPSYYGRRNNVIIVNNIENASSGTVRYGRRAPRGSNGIVNGDGIRERTSTPSAAERVRVRDRNATGATERTRNTTRTVDRERSNTDRIRSREGRVGSPAERRNSTRPSSTNRSNDRINSRTRSGNLEQRGTINKDAYRRPQRNSGSNGTRTTPSRKRNYSPSPSRSSGSRYGGSTPNRSTPNRTRSSSPNRSSSPSRMRSSSPSRSSTPSRSRTRSSSPSRSTPNRSSGSGSRTRNRN